jgi:hypothetical protein
MGSMQTYRLTFDLEGAGWTEVHRARSRFVAIQIARAMLELLVAELAPRLALVAVKTHEGDLPCGGWGYACDRPRKLLWEPPEPTPGERTVPMAVTEGFEPSIRL